MLGDFSDNENDSDGTIIKTKKYERRGRSGVLNSIPGITSATSGSLHQKNICYFVGFIS